MLTKYRQRLVSTHQSHVFGAIPCCYFALQRLGLLTPNTPLGGSSAGAIVATAVASGLSEADILDGLSALVADYRGGVSLRVALRKQLLRLTLGSASTTPFRCFRGGR